ncbi:MAG: ATP-dependent DNA helicase RecG [Bacteroidetes bacterium]|nr:MAG: ATP-dependent DNA helicase RecG [Bacteroidota bacterium]
MNTFLKSDIKFLKGVGSVRAEILNKELGIFTYGDLLSYYPFRYVDRSKFYQISEIEQDSSYIQLKGKIVHVSEAGQRYKSRLVATFTDGERELELLWFKSVNWIKSNIKIGEEIVIFGKPSFYNGKVNMTHPELDTVINRTNAAALEAVYHTTEQMKNRRVESKAIRQMMKSILSNEQLDIPEIFDDEMCEKHKLIPRRKAFRFIHHPPSSRHIDAAQYRFKFEELFFLQLPFIKQKINRGEAEEGIKFNVKNPLFEKFVTKHLPFALTGAQERVLTEIKTDLCTGKQMNRLLQGDVGSGKTIVAFLSVLMAIDNDCQASLMAPTEILAIQHYIGLKEMADKIGIEIGILTGSSKTKERRELHKKLRNGEIKLLIGTHALIEDVVKFKNLGLTIIDEQHRFGVAQRAKLQEKGKINPHVLVMTATPIPRTLAMSVYGDLDYSVIDEMPAGRKPIKTAHRFGFAREKIWAFVKEELARGRQAYIVYPLIEESETLHYKDLNNGYDQLLQFFPRPEYQVEMLHGKMKPADKEAKMKDFADGKTDILVSTTVIEVGINVPNASIMVIESSEKFGLSQLHQLRGRVGRGAEQSYCILISSKKLSENGRTRLKAMVSTTSGFELSEIDMQLRGFGDIAGTRQSGLDQLKLASLSDDADIAEEARNAIVELLQTDPELTNHESLKHFMSSRQGHKAWENIA